MILITLAGTPATTQLSGTSLISTLLASTIEYFTIFTDPVFLDPENIRLRCLQSLDIYHWFHTKYISLQSFIVGI
jgi:hypothetical protein